MRELSGLANNMTEDAEIEFLAGRNGGPWLFQHRMGCGRVGKCLEGHTRSEKSRNRNGPVASPPANVDLPIARPATVGRPSPRVGIMGSLILPAIRVVRICTPGRSSSDTMSLESAPCPSIHQSTSATIQGENVVRELSRRVAHLLDACKYISKLCKNFLTFQLVQVNK
jgi:hypothetical protein